MSQRLPSSLILRVSFTFEATRLLRMLDVLQVQVERADGALNFDERNNQGNNHDEKGGAENDFRRHDRSAKKKKHADGAQEKARDAAKLHVAHEPDAPAQILNLVQIMGRWSGLMIGVQFADRVGQGDKPIGVSQQQERDGGE